MAAPSQRSLIRLVSFPGSIPDFWPFSSYVRVSPFFLDALQE
ncbi:MAG: hypothetical protein OZSIB_4095 [Candidatus Ozemobacter sibiricus]|uniref:Uncharacterized protein n=1 Tax=Candidatus Ozemobacter sibiricus TaxID=2268124 RepID=A0A367ZNC9_9BACT|nr:MAG: hypothetical protein OZSIB_4095 [Candidatus Ozemobacter sibiricus]